MSFGFSIGDFIAGSKLVADTWGLLKDGTGSAADYQSLVLLRRNLGAILEVAQREFKATRPLPSILNAVEEEIRQTTSLLQKFDKLTKKYHESLSTIGGSGKKAKDVQRKLQWGLLRRNLTELFTVLHEHITSIGLLFSASTW
jgi:hypothetical protein